MLRIKKEVDLKELEKFGFKKIDKNYRGHKYVWTRQVGEYGYYSIYINRNNYIRIEISDQAIIAGKLQTKLYDLIKADLVEKVEE